MNRKLRLIVSAILLVSSFAATNARAASKYPSEIWMGVYLGKMKLGYSRFYTDQETFEGKPGFRVESASLISVGVLGTNVEQKVDTVTHLNAAYEPVYEVFEMSSGGVSTKVTARFSPKEIVAVTDSGGAKSTKKIPIPKGSKLVADDNSALLNGAKIKVGDKMSFRSFNPLTLSLDEISLEVMRTEDLAVEDGPRRCFVVKSVTPMGNSTSWEDENGEIIKIEMEMGFTMLRETKEAALAKASSYVPSPDLALMTSAQTAIKITNPRTTKYLKVKLTGFADGMQAISDDRQKAVFSAADKSAVYEITSATLPSAVLDLPIKREGMEGDLAETQYFQTKDAGIRSTAEQIVGKEKNSLKAAGLIRDWVYQNMRTSGAMGVVRSSTEILRSKTGVCRDYATLYTTLARAAGIPTRFVAGMVYWKDAFYYHAWAESFVGEWVPMDPTFGGEFVDATHIKLDEGDSQAMFRVVKSVGLLKAEVLDFK